MSNTTNILDFWPFVSKPRLVQIHALEWMAKQTSKYIILEAPVGSGKSLIGVTYSNYIGQRLPSGQRGDAFILTPQKILQAQYEESFRGNDNVNLASFYGKSNYDCRHKKTTCDIGELVKPLCHTCPFAQAKLNARAAANTVMNYKLALLAFQYTSTFNTKRELMIMDECHTLENHLVDFDAVTITEHRCKKHGIDWVVKRTIPEVIEWLVNQYLPKITKTIDKMEEDCETIAEKSSKDLTSVDIRKLRDFKALQDHYDEVFEVTILDLDDLKENFVLVHDKQQIAFKRLTGAHSFQRIIVPKANRFLFMSSTILDKDGFCRDLGIHPDDAAFLSVESEFPKENRPVVFMPQMKMNAEWNKPENTKNRKLMAATVKQLLDSHADESGVIHTGNYAIAKWLVEELEFNIKQRIHHHNPGSGDDRGSVISVFMADVKPSVLISPSATEGLDLKEDLGRFAIIVKCPYGNLGDQWIKRRMELSNEWYQRRALIDIIQGGGRVVRSPTDKGNVYILDMSFAYLYNNTRHMIPKWWKEAYATI